MLLPLIGYKQLPNCAIKNQAQTNKPICQIVTNKVSKDMHIAKSSVCTNCNEDPETIVHDAFMKCHYGTMSNIGLRGNYIST